MIKQAYLRTVIWLNSKGKSAAVWKRRLRAAGLPSEMGPDHKVEYVVCQRNNP